MEFIIFLIIIVVLILNRYIKKTPPNTALIIDRNTHYHKTVLHGFYLFNPKTDFITTQISTNTTQINYSSVFETHDSRFYHMNFSVSYKTNNIESVLDSLKSSRRSIYDVINSTISSTFFNFEARKLSEIEFKEELLRELRSNLAAFYIELQNFKIISMSEIPANIGKDKKFKKHISQGNSPIKFG